MNGAVAAAGGDMAKAALQAGLIDRIGDRREFEARLAAARRRRGQADRRIQAGRARLLCCRHGRPAAERSDRDGHDRRHDRRRQGGPGHRRGRHIAKQIEDGIRTRASRRSSFASTARAARSSRPSASARRCSRPKRKKFRSSCRWAVSPLRAAIGSRPRRLHLRRALDDHRVDRGVRGAAELPGHAPEAGRRRRRREDHAAVG